MQFVHRACFPSFFFPSLISMERYQLIYERRTFAATGDGSLPLPPRGSAWLLRCLLDVRNVRIVEIQGERVGHGYGETSGNYYW